MTVLNHLPTVLTCFSGQCCSSISTTFVFGHSERFKFLHSLVTFHSPDTGRIVEPTTGASQKKPGISAATRGKGSLYCICYEYRSKLEDTARYAGFLPAPAEGFNFRLGLFLLFGQKRAHFRSFFGSVLVKAPCPPPIRYLPSLQIQFICPVCIASSTM